MCHARIVVPEAMDCAKAFTQIAQNRNYGFYRKAYRWKRVFAENCKGLDQRSQFAARAWFADGIRERLIFKINRGGPSFQRHALRR